MDAGRLNFGDAVRVAMLYTTAPVSMWAALGGNVNILSTAAKGAAEGLIAGVGSIIDNLHTSTEEKLAAKHAAAELAQKTLDTVVQVGIAETNAKRDVIVAEMSQGDTFTKRARPWIIYAGLGFIGINHVAFPVLGRTLALAVLFFADKLDDAKVKLAAELTAPLPPLPSDFWLTWGGVAGLWVVGRTLERGGVVSGLVSKITGNVSPSAQGADGKSTG